jgi:hypothetical protein
MISKETTRIVKWWEKILLLFVPTQLHMEDMVVTSYKIWRNNIYITDVTDLLGRDKNK